MHFSQHPITQGVNCLQREPRGFPDPGSAGTPTSWDRIPGLASENTTSLSASASLEQWYVLAPDFVKGLPDAAFSLVLCQEDLGHQGLARDLQSYHSITTAPHRTPSSNR